MSAGAESRALVTGASSGIGAAYARALRARGERLVLVARRGDRLQALQAELGGPDVVSIMAVDLARPEAAAQVEATLRERGIVLDLLVNNAGGGHTGRFHEEPPERLLGMVDLNVRALVALTRTFLPSMVARGRGRIVNVASTAAFQPVPFLSVYAATKAFVLSFTEALATELRGSGIRVQCLCPGPTETEFFEAAGGHEGLRVMRLPRLSSKAVVEASLRGLEKGRVVEVVGAANRLVVGLQTLVPRALVRTVAGSLYRPR